MAKAPEDACAVETGNRSVIFYVDNGGLLSYLEGPVGGAEIPGDEPNYKTYFITIEDQKIPVHDDFKRVTAVAYDDPSQNGDREVRVYFVNKRKILEEICRTNEGSWYRGTLGNKIGYSVASGSALTANVQMGSRQLKVFFTKKEESPKMSCTWVALGQKNWTPRAITDDNIIW